MKDEIIAHGRVGLLGNPSDIYFGQVISATINKFKVNAMLKKAKEMNLLINGNKGDEGFEKLVFSTVNYLKKQGIELEPFSIEAETDIPKQAGLGGSAALIISLLKGLNQTFNLELGIRKISHYATKIEHEEIGITAGPQDRFVICCGGVKYMDFSSKNYETYELEELDISKIPFYVGVRSKNISSGDVHKFPYQKYPKSEKLQNIVAEIAQCAVKGRSAIKEGDLDTIGNLMNKNQKLTQKYGTFGNPNQRVKLQREIDQEILDFCNENEVMGAKLGGSSGSIIILSDEKPEFLFDFKPSPSLLKKLEKFDKNPDQKQISEIIELQPAPIYKNI